MQPGAGVRVRSCARNQDDLLFGVRSALENRDANRLADFYHWTGMGTAEGYRVMNRLSAVSERPLVDVQLVSSADAPPRHPRAPDLLRVDQMRGNEDAGALVTYFHLRSNAGCWWLQF